MDNRYEYLICVKCMTFNQSQFVEDALNGFCMQKTDFPYVCVIVDDSSTDGEPEVISKYLKEHFDLSDKAVVRNEETEDYVLTFAKHKTNEKCYFAVLFLKYNHYRIGKSKQPYIFEWDNHTKYTALCEGDDYWTDPLKLQRQFDFLENHPDYSVISHRFSIYDQDKKIFESDGNERVFKTHKGIVFDHYSKGFIAKTLTLVYRVDALTEYNKYPGTKWDIVLVYFLLKQGKGYCLANNMGTYRKHMSNTYGKKSYIEQKRIKYLQYKELFNYEKNPFTRKCYYTSLIRLLFFSHGSLFHDIEFSLSDLIFVPYYSICGILRVLTGKTLYRG